MHDLDRRQLLAAAASAIAGMTVPAPALASLIPSRRYLSDNRFALLSAIADTMVPSTDTPGALQTGVAELFDALLRNWASMQRRDQIATTLAQIDMAAVPWGGSFAALSPSRRYDVLAAFDRQQAADPGYAMVKKLIISLYYCTEPACTLELPYELSPGAWEPSLPVTPETRAWGGAILR